MTKNEKLEQKLAAAGIVTYADARDWLGFTDEEKALCDMQIAAERALERKMKETRVTQKELAKRMGTKQPAVSRMLRHVGSTSFEQIFRALLALGESPRKIAASLVL
ncbi:MAG: XRE family transcriptional regulator [Kiritimatiellae bacterium]|nr:XRE family transcriptional regulator [Kiritimatiellia bacterium]